ncbi:hypothetical protein LZ30DRAFT_719473 [Colletotrichum cereale]|nr:hypothetical protein LZ30DRAFT_719473 [Colletotrichum cereale]
MAECGFIAATDPPPLTITTTTTTTPLTASPTAMTTLPPLLLAPGEPLSPSGSATSPPPSPASPTSTSFPAATTTRVAPTPVTPVTVFETPSFSALPPLVLPNDVSSAPPVLEQNGNQMSGAPKGPGGASGGWPETRRVVLVVVIGMILS